MGLLLLLYTFTTDHNLICSAPFSKFHLPKIKWYLLLTISFRFCIVVLINLHFLQLPTAQLHSLSQTKGMAVLIKTIVVPDLVGPERQCWPQPAE